MESTPRGNVRTQAWQRASSAGQRAVLEGAHALRTVQSQMQSFLQVETTLCVENVSITMSHTIENVSINM